MSFEADLRAYIVDNASPVKALINTRMYPIVVPQSPTFPLITYSTISAIRGHHMTGPDRLPTQRMQIDAWATTFAVARSLADAIRERIDSFKGLMTSTEVQGIFFDTERHLYEQDGSTVYFRISQDFLCWFEE
jgi:hypothetical protein